MPNDTPRTRATSSLSSTASTKAGSQPPQHSKIMIGLYTLIVVLLLVMASLAVMITARPATVTIGDVDTDTYQAVFLTNGQVYFGKLAGVKGPFIELKDIYYLRVNQQIQPEEEVAGTRASSTNASDQNIVLVKLGSELHKPTPEMMISREQVLFWENLEKDSPVVKAIQDEKSGGSNNSVNN
jgi:hypothetical protein